MKLTTSQLRRIIKEEVEKHEIGSYEADQLIRRLERAKGLVDNVRAELGGVPSKSSGNAAAITALSKMQREMMIGIASVRRTLFGPDDET